MCRGGVRAGGLWGWHPLLLLLSNAIQAGTSMHATTRRLLRSWCHPPGMPGSIPGHMYVMWPMTVTRACRTITASHPRGTCPLLAPPPPLRPVPPPGPPPESTCARLALTSRRSLFCAHWRPSPPASSPTLRTGRSSSCPPTRRGRPASGPCNLQQAAGGSGVEEGFRVGKAQQFPQASCLCALFPAWKVGKEGAPASRLSAPSMLLQERGHGHSLVYVG